MLRTATALLIRAWRMATAWSSSSVAACSVASSALRLAAVLTIAPASMALADNRIRPKPRPRRAPIFKSLKFMRGSGPVQVSSRVSGTQLL